MPPRTKAPAGFASLIESDSEPDFDSFEAVGPRSARELEQVMPALKSRGRPPTAASANRVTKPSQRGQPRTRGGTSRQALQERSSNLSPKARRGRKPNETQEDSDLTESNTAPKQMGRGRANASVAGRGGSAVRGGRGRPPKAKPTPAEETPADWGHEPEPRDEVELQPGTAEEGGVSSPTAEPADEEMNDVSGDDVSLRRRLGDLSRRHESLEARYKDLREVGVKEAESNFERLKKQSEENTAAANRLISELKAELAAQASLSKQLESSETKCNGLHTQVADLTGSLTTARSEIKTLSNKLAAARSAEANIKVPGSALKNPANRSGLSAEAVQTAQAKEDLYGDLTGLIIRGMKHEDTEVVFDCIQTGRNGTLHFKLGLEGANSDNYEDVKYTYRPQLDEDRDGELMDMLPDFLVEEITFARPHASKFYTRIIKSLTERFEG